MLTTVVDGVARFGLTIYMALFLGVAMVWPTYRVWRRTGVNPYVLGRGEDPHSYVGGLFRLCLSGIAIIVVVAAAAPEAKRLLTPIEWLTTPLVAWIGAALLVVALGWVLVAQWQMGDSWRIGVDEARATPLISRGLFARSRNPIFLGMLIMLLGFVLVLPSAASLTVSVLGYALIQIQVRLEEEHLARLHGEAYRVYRASVPRWW